MSKIEEIKKEIDSIRREQIRLEKLLAKQEDDGIYDESIYEKIDSLESKYNDLQTELDKIA